jgi:hypothetical protein
MVSKWMTMYGYIYTKRREAGLALWYHFLNFKKEFNRGINCVS